MKKILKTPLLEDDARRLRVGDIIYVTGLLVTARDAAHGRIHRYLADSRDLPFDLEGLALFHCGPVVRRENGGWAVLAAGPTTSMRMEAFGYELIGKLGVRLIIGKGGMGDKTRSAMMKYGAAYAVFTGGAAVLAARHIKRVIGVEWMDLGMPEAVWTFEVEEFGPLVVAIDSHGRNLFEETLRKAEAKKTQLLKKIGADVLP